MTEECYFLILLWFLYLKSDLIEFCFMIHTKISCDTCSGMKKNLLSEASQD